MNTTTHHTSVAGMSGTSAIPLSEVFGRFELLGDRLNGLDSSLAVLLGRIDPVLVPVNTASGGTQASSPAAVESEVSARISIFCDYVEQITNRVQDANSRLAL